MAVVDGDEFKIPISVDDKFTANITKIIDGLKSSLAAIPKSVDLSGVQNQLGKLDSELKSVSSTLKVYDDSFKQAETTIKAQAEAIDKLSTGYDSVTTSSTAFGASLGAVAAVPSVIAKATVAFNTLSAAVTISIRLFEILSDPTRWIKLANHLKTIAFLLDLKGAPKLAGAFQAAGEKADEMATQIERLNLISSVYNSTLEQQIGFVSGLATSFGNLIVFVNDVNSAVDQLTSPANLKKLSDLSNILSVLARYKGYNDLADGLHNVGDKLDDVAIKVEQGGTLSSTFDMLASRARTFNDALDKTKETIGVLGTAVIGSGLVKLAFQSELVSSSFSKMVVFLGKNIQGVEKFGNAFADIVAPGILNAAKAAGIAGPVLFSLGMAAQESENAFVRFAGKIAIVASLLATSFSVSLVFVSKALGNLMQTIGQELNAVISEYVKVSVKAQAVTSAFRFTIEGFTRILGSEAVGTMTVWNNLTKEIVASSTYTTQQVQKGISLLIKEGQALGLSVAQNTKLLKIAADVASATGNEIEDVVLRITQGLSGQSQGLLALGINVQDAALEHTKYIKETGRTVESLSNAEKQQLRFNEIVRQSLPLLGASEAKLLTVAGAQTVLGRNVEQLQIKIGNASEFTRLFNVALASIASTLLDVPDPIIQTVGAIADFSSVVLQVAGFITKYILGVSLLVTVYKGLNLVLESSIIVQTSLNVVYGLAAARVDTQVVAITNLKTLIQATTTLMKAGFIVAFLEVVAVLKTAGAATLRFGAALLLNPMVATGVAIAVGIMAIVKAISEVADAFDKVEYPIRNTGKQVGILTKAWDGFINLLTNSFGVIKDLSKILITVFAGGIYGLIVAYDKLKLSFMSAGPEAQAVRDEISDINLSVDALRTQLISAGRDTANFFTGAAFAAKKAAPQITDGLDSVGMAAVNLSARMSDVRLMVKQSAESMNANIGLADEFDKTTLAIDEANQAYNLAIDAFTNGAGDQKEAQEKVRKTLDDLNKAYSEQTKLRQSTFEKATQQTEQLRTQALKAGGDGVKAVQIETAAKLVEFDKQFAAVAKLGKLTTQETERLTALRVAIVAGGEADIIKIQAEAGKKMQKETEEQTKARVDGIKKLQAQYTQLKIEQLTADGNVAAANALQMSEALRLHDDEIEALKAKVELRQEDLDLAMKVRAALQQKSGDKNAKQILDLVEKIDTQRLEAQKEILTDQDDIITLVRIENEARSKMFEDRVTQLMKLKAFSAKEIEDLQKIRDLIGEANALKADAAQGTTIGDVGNAVVDTSVAAYEGAKSIFTPQTATAIKSTFADSAGIMKSAWAGMKDAGNYMVDAFAGIELMSIAELFVAAFNPSNINALADAINSMVDFPAMLMDALGNLSAALSRFISEFPKAFADMAKNIGPMLQEILSKLPEFISALLDGITAALPDLFTAMIGVVYKVAEIIPTIIENIAERLPQIVEGLAAGMTEVAIAFVDASIRLWTEGGIERIVGSLLRAIPRIVVGFVEGVVSGLQNGLMRLFGGQKIKLDTKVLEEAGENISKSFKKVGDEIKRSTSQLFKLVDGEAAARGLDIGDRIAAAIQGAGTIVSTALTNVVGGEDDKGGSLGLSIWNGFLKPIGEWFEKAGGLIWDGFIAVADIFGEWGTKIWDGFVMPVLGWFGEMGTKIWNGFVKPIGNFFIQSGKNIWNGLKEVATLFGEWGTAIWNGIIEPVATWFGDRGTEIWNGFILPLANWFGDRGTEIWNSFAKDKNIKKFGDWGTSIWEKFAANDAVETIGEWGTKIWKGLKSNLTVENLGKVGGYIWKGFMDFGDAAGEIGTAIWDGLLAIAKSAGEIGTDIWKGFKKAISPDFWSGIGEKIKDKLTTWSFPSFSWPAFPSFSWPDIPKPGWFRFEKGGLVSSVGRIASSNTLHLANGGYVGMGHSIDVPQGRVVNGILHAQGGAFAQGTDTVAAKLTPGEFVVNREATRNNLGLLSFINENRSPVGNGGTVNNFSIVINAKTDLSVEQIRREIIPEMEKQLKRKSQEGRSVIDKRGVR
jgi:hypothetical protein